MSNVHSSLPSTSPYIRSPAVYSLALGVRMTASVFSDVRAPVMTAFSIPVTSTVPNHISAKPVGWSSVTSTPLSGRARQKPASVARGRTRFPESSSNQLRDQYVKNGRPSVEKDTSCPKRKSSIVG